MDYEEKQDKPYLATDFIHILRMIDNKVNVKNSVH